MFSKHLFLKSLKAGEKETSLASQAAVFWFGFSSDGFFHSFTSFSRSTLDKNVYYSLENVGVSQRLTQMNTLKNTEAETHKTSN